MLLRKIINIYSVSRMEHLTMPGQNIVFLNVVLVHTETTVF
jgi:hypothetical protein